MTTVMIHHRVADYDAWKIEYDRVLEMPLSAAVQTTAYRRGNLRIQRSGREDIDNPDLLPELVKAGVEMDSVRMDYVDLLEQGSH